MKIFRNLFGKNDKIHIDEIAMKQGNNPILLSGAVIVESGSNSNGDYVKFGDGLMICHRTATLDFESMVDESFEYPIPFGYHWYSNIMFNPGTDPRYRKFQVNVSVIRSNSHWRIVKMETTPVFANPVHLFAIGRWK